MSSVVTAMLGAQSMAFVGASVRGVSLVTHSGPAFSTLLRARRGFEFRLAVSSGQELVTNTADYVDYALDDLETRVIGLLLETPRDVPRLRQTLLRAAEQDVPVVILTVGGSPRYTSATWRSSATRSNCSP